MQKPMALLLTCLFSVAVLAESAAGLRWTTPAGWKNEGALPMRAATYTVAAAPGDKAGAECIVSYFGAGQGGTVEANVDRWKGQFRGADGKPPAAQIAKRTIHGLKVTTVDTSGEYSGLGGPIAGGQRTVPGYRLLGAIVEGPGGNVFVKFTGPANTVSANQQKFEQLLASFEPAK